MKALDVEELFDAREREAPCSLSFLSLTPPQKKNAQKLSSHRVVGPGRRLPGRRGEQQRASSERRRRRERRRRLRQRQRLERQRPKEAPLNGRRRARRPRERHLDSCCCCCCFERRLEREGEPAVELLADCSGSSSSSRGGISTDDNSPPPSPLRLFRSFLLPRRLPRGPLRRGRRRGQRWLLSLDPLLLSSQPPLRRLPLRAPRAR